MSDVPFANGAVPWFIMVHSLHSLGMETPFGAFRVTGDDGPGSGAWPSNNLAIYVPFTVQRPVVVTQVWAFNGSSVSGNLDIGVYDYALNKVATAGSTAQSGTSSLQLINIADFSLPAGRYYMALASSTTAATFQRLSTTGIDRVMKATGCAQQASALALPASATFAAIGQAYLPQFGLVVGKVT